MSAQPAEVPVDAGSLRILAALDDDSRRALYAYIRESHSPITREQAAEKLGISRKLAGFHLDKLVDVGLLTTSPDPNARKHVLGRNPKSYLPADVNISVTIPNRQAGLLAGLLVEAIVTAEPDETARDAALRVAGRRGRELGEATRATARAGRVGAERGLTLAESALRHLGFEPSRESTTRIRLMNCPFHPFAANNPEFVCQLNHRMLAEFLEGLHATNTRAVLSPRSGECCVELNAVRR